MSDDNAARAIADVSTGLILATVTIAAPPERIFAALTDPSELPRWWGADDLYRTTTHTSDLRKGGAWRSEGRGARPGRPSCWLSVSPTLGGATSDSDAGATSPGAC